MQRVLSKPANIAELEEVFKKYVLAVKVPDQEENRKTKSTKNKQLDKSIFDIDAAAEILGDKESAWRIFDLLCQGLPSEILQVKAAQKENDVNALREIFHKIKGGLGFAKTPQLLAATIELHDAVKLKPLSEIDELFKNFYEAAEILLAAYKASDRVNKKDI
jgi:HPt (histidine-containing phosphotransfer) domain-containing protein